MFKSAADLDSIFDNFFTSIVPNSVKPEDIYDVVDTAIFIEDIKEFVRRKNPPKDNTLGS